MLFSCEIDTYEAPAETLRGRLICSDGNDFQSEQPNGFKIRLNEIVDGKVANLPQDFWGKPDGTFNNTKIFKGTYVVQPIEGAFFTVEPVEIRISGTTEVNFEVTPYLNVIADVKAKGPDLVAKYRVEQARGAGKITTARVLLSKWNPNVGMNRIDYEKTRDLRKMNDSDITSTSFTDTIQDCLEPGVTYYARIAVLAANAAGRYNFSEVFKIVIDE